MTATFDDRDRKHWKPARLHRAMKRVLDQGNITGWHMVRTGPVLKLLTLASGKLSLRW